MRLAARVVTLGMLISLSLAASADTLTGKVVKVTDGDSITVLDSTNTQYRIRLQGIDAPETGQASARSAGVRLGYLIP